MLQKRKAGRVLRTLLVRAFERRGYEANAAKTATSAIERAAGDSPEMAVVDLRLPDGSGLEVIRRLKAIDPCTSIVVLTGMSPISHRLAVVLSVALLVGTTTLSAAQSSGSASSGESVFDG
jgi:ActR/RegA family two-component response regulator